MNSISFKGAVSVYQSPISVAHITPYACGDKSFGEAVEFMDAGDIFTLKDSSHNSSIGDGMYMVNYKDGGNEGVCVTKLDEENSSVASKGNSLYTADNVNGTCKPVGHLNIKA